MPAFFFRLASLLFFLSDGPDELCSFSKLSVASPTSQLILQPFRRFTFVIAHFPTLPLLHLRHSSFSNPSFASSTSQVLHLHHLASRPWSSSVFCPRAGPSLHAQEPRLKCRRQFFHCKLRNQCCSFTRDWIDSVTSRCFSHSLRSSH